MLLSLLLYTDIDVDFILFLIRVDLLRIIYIYGQVKGLVLHFVALDVSSFGWGSTLAYAADDAAIWFFIG